MNVSHPYTDVQEPVAEGSEAKRKKGKRSLADPPLLKRDDPRMLNVGELAEALGVNYDYVVAMKRFGFKMPLGRATIAMADDWLRKNADYLAEQSLDASPSRGRRGGKRS